MHTCVQDANFCTNKGTVTKMCIFATVPIGVLLKVLGAWLFLWVLKDRGSLYGVGSVSLPDSINRRI